jgi:hypothetical protein
MHDGFIEDYEIRGVKFLRICDFFVFFWAGGKDGRNTVVETTFSRHPHPSETGLWTACPP